MKKIKSISFLHEGKRLRAHCSSNGKFQVEDSDVYISPMDLVTHSQVKLGDPVLTLEDGDKVRVYQGGDPNQFVVTAVSILENHERKIKLKNKLLGRTGGSNQKKTQKSFKQMRMGFDASRAGSDYDTLDEDLDDWVDDHWGFDYLNSLWLSND